MYYRRKILLALLQIFNGELEKLRLQKLLFLLSQIQKENRTYYFVPYKFGCFSLQANVDLFILEKNGSVKETEINWLKADEKNYISELKENDKQALKSVKQLYGIMSTDELIRHTYMQYPYYAINSTIVNNYLSDKEIMELDNYKYTENKTVLFTIGYEGISLEQYLNKLIQNNIKVLCDVRKNALSMKYGFSKKQLQNACEGVRIKYIHFPEVGINADERQSLKTQADYDKLFLKYNKEILPNVISKQKEILNVLKIYRRVALTCFEANVHKCHRKHLAEAITNLSAEQVGSPEFAYELKHI